VRDLTLAGFQGACPPIPLGLQLLGPLPRVFSPLTLNLSSLPLGFNDRLQPFDLFL
jgi:hypothetical protein